MDGQVAGNTTYLEWLSRQSPARQDEVLRSARGKLFRDGKLELSERFTDKGEWITFEQLRQVSHTKEAGQMPGFSLAGARTVTEIEQDMRGIIANDIRFPEGTR